MKSEAASSQPQQEPHILLVDDNHMGLVARRQVLQELGYRITSAQNPEQALEAFANNTFDLVITDFKMPRMNGLELIGHVRALRPDVPVVLISGFADTLGLNEANTSADVVIQKSANEVNHLIRAVTRLLKRKTPKKPAASSKAQLRDRRKGV